MKIARLFLFLSPEQVTQCILNV
uniref:Uncharacterized protein n=1 Tax=Arundo donax TaxID=35708 RepID=A0A0A9BED6_ARUDO